MAGSPRARIRCAGTGSPRRAAARRPASTSCEAAARPRTSAYGWFASDEASAGRVSAAPGAPPLPCASARGLVLDRLDLERDPHLVAEEESALVERLVPDDPEVLAIQRHLGGEPGAGAAPRIRRLAQVRHRERDALPDAADAERAGHIVAILAGAPHRLAAEDELRMVLDVEEVRAPEVLV